MEKSIFELLKRPIAYQPITAKAFGSVKLAVLWCQIYYWHDKTNNPDGWIYKTREQVYDETGLSRVEQENARKLGAKLGVLESKRMGQRCIVHFRIDQEKAAELVEEYLKNQPEMARIGIKTETVVGKQEPKIEKERNEIKRIFEIWNGAEVVNHRKMTGQIESKIRSVLREYSEKEIEEAIKKYATVLNGEEYFWTYRWTLPEFLQRGLTRFLETPVENFKLKTKAKKIKEFYRGNPMVESRGKKWVIEDGQWLEFAGDPKDIEKREV